MQTHTLQTWIARRLLVRQRLARVCTSYVLFLMVVTTKHTLEEAARFSGLHKSLFSKMLQSHAKVAISTLENLSKKQAKHLAKPLHALKGLPWKIAILMESTLQHRASLHPENAKKFNHGQGFVIGHQWTNIVLIINEMLIPLAPIPYYSKRYCRDHHLTYHTEHELVLDYLGNLHLEDYIGSYDLGCLNRPSDVDRFLDFSSQSRFSHVWWPSIFNHTRGLLGHQRRPILVFTTH